MARFEALLSRYRSSPRALRVVVVGGGAGGVELCLSLAHRLEQERKEAGLGEDARCSFT